MEMVQRLPRRYAGHFTIWHSAFGTLP